MKHFLSLLSGLLVFSALRADVLGDAVDITPVAGWELADSRELRMPPIPFPTLYYVPKDGRNAKVLLTLIPNEIAKVSDLASLKKFHRILSRLYLPTPDTEMTVIDRKLPQASLVYASFVDPKLIGKPAREGDFKVATSAAVLVNGGVMIHATLLTDTSEGSDFFEGLKIIQSAAPHKPLNKSPAAQTPTPAKDDDRQTIGFRPYSSVLWFPMRFEKTPKLNSDSNYFSYRDEKHVMLSGWLDQPKDFKGMREFWAKEKIAMTKEGGISIAEESFTIINGWTVVRYVVNIADSPPQKNIRACRVVGDTWADIHLATMEPTATWKDLEDVLKELSLAPK